MSTQINFEFKIGGIFDSVLLGTGLNLLMSSTTYVTMYTITLLLFVHYKFKNNR